MEKINYGYVFEKNYPNCKWSVQSGRKAYEYDAYVWNNANSVPLPEKSELDLQWQTLKRDTWIWQAVITERNKKLQESDHYALPDYPHASPTVKQAWLDYRQELRDFTETAAPSFSEEGKLEVEWPVKPS